MGTGGLSVRASCERRAEVIKDGGGWGWDREGGAAGAGGRRVGGAAGASSRQHGGGAMAMWTRPATCVMVMAGSVIAIASQWQRMGLAVWGGGGSERGSDF